MKKKIAILGAGPAGITAAYELSKNESFEVHLFEKSNQPGGISRTVNYKGNKIDIGGHRFFSKSERVMNWWLDMLPLAPGQEKIEKLAYQNQQTTFKHAPKPNGKMLLRKRKSRILYNGKFYDYPIQLNRKNLAQLGISKIIKIGWSYFWSRFHSQEDLPHLEAFFISRFGKELYHTFFKNYTEKVWGVKCTEIDASWGAQRVKSLSLKKMIGNYLSPKKEKATSLINYFLYPEEGPGQMWQTALDKCVKNGVQVHFNQPITQFESTGRKINAIKVSENWVAFDHVISSIPLKHLVGSNDHLFSPSAVKIANQLPYRDFIIVGLLVNATTAFPQDNWIYLHDEKVKAARLQIFNNWSPKMVAENNKVWLGFEYFCNKDDKFWQQSDEKLMQIAIADLKATGFDFYDKVEDGTVIRMPKTYPSYTGNYDAFQKVIPEILSIENLHCIGRNGLHRYNNQDHSMLTAFEVVRQIQEDNIDHQKVWNINTDDDYHEE